MPNNPASQRDEFFRKLAKDPDQVSQT